MDELKPCPFCGGSKLSEYLNGFIYCRQCGSEGGAEWNFRPIEDALNKRIAELKERLRWIPVSERLPDKDTVIWVLGISTNWDIPIQILWTENEWTWIEHDGTYVKIPSDNLPTHWMPLPKPPEEE